MPSFWTRQPGTAIYTALFVAAALVRLPWLCVLYVFPLMRPDHHWTFRQSLSRTLFADFGKYAATIEIQPPATPESATEKRQVAIIQPTRDGLYRNILLCDPTICPGAVSAVWHTKPITHPGQHHRGQRVFLHLHGGAYVLGDGRDIGIRFMSSLFLQACPESATFCPEYRLSSVPGGRFPAALQDAVTAYSFLVHDLEIPSKDIVLSGDSAGAHLAIGLLRYINANPDILPEPAALLLWSPWPDMIIDVDIADERPATHVDHVAPKLIAWAYREFLPRAETGIARSDPYLSPVTAAIPTEVPIWVQWGAAEILKPEVKKFVHVQESGARNARVGTCEVPHAPHDILTLAPILGWKSEAAGAVKEAFAFLDKFPTE
ncbi:Alpha/Beta hydrolase protein [Hypoxylon rubiginosum]|uniref:Alpha/Beta hydrolase protein n=1 Tax=Hypoxylon rubiginosum TaxID=110542 RepID=A0ACC0DC81_9PEZI|nr:Alpha/Beta hydrolase protein [Hypoxylon rubiginosum]